MVCEANDTSRVYYFNLWNGTVVVNSNLTLFVPGVLTSGSTVPGLALSISWKVHIELKKYDTKTWLQYFNFTENKQSCLLGQSPPEKLESCWFRPTVLGKRPPQYMSWEFVLSHSLYESVPLQFVHRRATFINII